ncbi:MAG: cell division protein ZapA [Elusimicrobiota bacterium]
MADKMLIKIMNRDYYINDNGDPLYMNAIARYVENKMKEAAEKDNIVDTSRLAVHAALTITGELFKYKDKEDELKGINEYRVDKLLQELDEVLT